MESGMHERKPMDERKLLAGLYAAGVALHLAFLALLLAVAPIDKWNWIGGDTGTYLEPAESFLSAGAFNRDGAPDCVRPIGYPLFLAGAIRLASALGADWRIVVYVAQAAIFALAYPAICFLGTALFGLGRRVALGCAAIAFLSGAFVAYVPIVLSDAMFATFLLAGVVCGVVAVRNASWLWACLEMAVVVGAAHVRPQLAIFPLAAAGIQWAYLRTRMERVDRRRKWIVASMLATTLAGVEAPALRNWVHHGVFTPSRLGASMYYDCLAKDVLRMKGQLARYDAFNARWQGLAPYEKLGERLAAKKKEAFAIFREYPLEAASHLPLYGVLNSIEMHWQSLFYLFRQTWYRDYEDGSVVWRPLPFLVSVPFTVFYGVAYLAALWQAYRFRRQPLVLASALLFLVPYAFCGMSYQGARYRLWLDPFVLLVAARTAAELARSLSVARGAEIRSGSVS